MPGASQCRSCGKTIWWVVSRKGRTYPPLVKMGKMVVVVLDGVAHTAPAYERHVCEEADIRAYNAYLAEEAEKAAAEATRRAEEKEENYRRRQERAERWAEIHEQAERFREASWRLGLQHACPKCHEPVGEPCMNLTKLRKGERVPTKNLHDERIEQVPRHLRPYWLDEFTVVVPEEEP